MNEIDDYREALEQCESDAEEFCQEIARLKAAVRWLVSCSETDGVEKDRHGQPGIGFDYSWCVIPDEHIPTIVSICGVR